MVFQIIFTKDGCQLFINGILVGVGGKGGKLIQVMMTMMALDPIPLAIIEVVSWESKTNCCFGGVNAIKYHSIAHSPARRERNTISNTAYVSELWK